MASWGSWVALLMWQDSEESKEEERGRQFEGRRDRHWDSKSTPLFDVKEYLSGILWNLQVSPIPPPEPASD